MPKLRCNTILATFFVLVLGWSVVYAYPPVADANGPYSGEAGAIINLDGSLSYHPDAGGVIISWEWDIDNDGQFDDASGQIIQSSWGSPGTYLVSLQVTDEAGATDVDTTIITISRSSTPSVPLMGQAAIPTAIAGGAAVTFWKKRRSRH